MSAADFPSFLEGLSLRLGGLLRPTQHAVQFPFLLGGAFIEAPGLLTEHPPTLDFPSFLEGLSLRRDLCGS